ncbi:MAG: hypothetical protein ABIY55_36095 [Kofleriaceae bacterium]
MPGDEFFRTRMGARFYEVTMPAITDKLDRMVHVLASVPQLVGQLDRLNTNLEALVVELTHGRRAGAAVAS